MRSPTIVRGEEADGEDLARRRRCRARKGVERREAWRAVRCRMARAGWRRWACSRPAVDEMRVRRRSKVVRRWGGRCHTGREKNKPRTMMTALMESRQEMMMHECSNLARVSGVSDKAVSVLAIPYIMGADARVPRTRAADIRSVATLYSTE